MNDKKKHLKHISLLATIKLPEKLDLEALSELLKIDLHAIDPSFGLIPLKDGLYIIKLGGVDLLKKVDAAKSRGVEINYFSNPRIRTLGRESEDE